MTGRRVVPGAMVAALGAWATLIGVGAPAATAQPCPDVEVVFARGTGEPPGVGGSVRPSSTRCAPRPVPGRWVSMP